MPSVFCRHNIDIFQDLERAQRDIGQVTDRRRYDVKHLLSSDETQDHAIQTD
jgi:hypothetical protein